MKRATFFNARGSLVRGFITAETVWDGDPRVVIREADSQDPARVYRCAFEGTTWVRGWRSRAARALAVANALAPL
ncbi:MAG TPA: hypothetical protein VGY48_15390 [Vicinamibacterales bacterium]|nr:hypothetical protein [Vicinamibacterales bacterium]